MSSEMAEFGAVPRLDPAAILNNVDIHLQPIVDIASGTCFAVEALARFGHAPGVPVEDVLAEAHRSGYGFALEAACLRAALARREEVPSDVRLAVNVSPDLLHHPRGVGSWPGDLDGVIIEVTEHQASRPDELHDQLAHLRRRGAAVAVDDVGTGYAGLLRLATTRPDIVKIDRTVVAGVRDSHDQGAVLEALVVFSHRLGAAVIGEGAEQLDDLIALAGFDVDYGQGWVVGSPAPTLEPISPLVVATCQQAREQVLQWSAGPGTPDRSQGMHSVTAAMSRATRLTELHAAVATAATEIGVDIISFSVLGLDGMLREVTASGEAIDTAQYVLADYPVTQNVVNTGKAAEVHLVDQDADPAERGLLRRLGHASLLIVPVRCGERMIGVLELGHRTHRRWTTHDVANGQGLATHLGDALLRIAG